MATRDERDGSRLAIELEPELRKRIAVAAAEQGVSMRDYIGAVLQRALDSRVAERPADQPPEWSQLSVRSFARDWESDADAVYDDLA